MHRNRASRLRVLRTVSLVSVLVLGACSRSQAPTEIEVRVDPRIELFSIIFRLAGNPEYSQGRIPGYVQATDAHFQNYRYHRAVELAKELRETRGISYDAVMNLAVHVSDPIRLRERVPFDPRPDGLEGRWSTESALGFLEEVRRFSAEADFPGFVKEHRQLYADTTASMQQLLQKHAVLDWFDGFFGARAGATFTVALGMLNGPANYGVKVMLPGGREEIYSVLGVGNVDDDGRPQFGPGVLPTLVHEFCHSYINPIVDAHSHELEEAGRKMFPLVETAMRRMAYGTWRTMIYESLVRACVIRYDFARTGASAAEKRIQREEKNHFFWIRGLVDLLEEYESSRDRYQSLDAFFPEVRGYFTKYAAGAEANIAAVEAGWEEERKAMAAKAPKIVSVQPPQGAQDVDPALDAITITFDRPMLDGHWGVMRIGPGFPKISGQVGFDRERRVFRMPVALEPDTKYAFGLNSENNLAFRDADGNPLMPVTVRFKTRKR